jgi:hypothetical protein
MSLLPLLFLVDASWAGATVASGSADFVNTSMSVRWRSFRNTGGRELYSGIHDLGSVRTSGSYRSRLENEVTWTGGSATLTAQYDPSTDTLVSTVVTGGRTTTQTYTGISVAAGSFASAGGLGAMDGLQITVTARDPGTVVSFNDVVLNGEALGDFTATYSSAPAARNWYDWTVSGVDFLSGWTISATLSLSGTFSYSQENGKVQLLLGELAAGDSDGDGDPDDTDCDDADASIYTGADEWCDVVDNDCDGTVDEDAVDAVPLYTDADSDGFGASLTGGVACPGIEGLITEGGDCDDTDNSLFPGAPEFCNDGVDQDCDGVVDNSCDIMEITIPATFTVSTRTFVDEDPSTLGTQIFTWVLEDYLGVTDRIAFITDSYVFNATGLNGAPINIGRTAATTHGDPNDAFIACGKAFASGPNLSGVASVWTPSFNVGTTKTASMYTFVADTDGDGVSDAAEVSVGCTDPANAASR